VWWLGKRLGGWIVVAGYSVFDFEWVVEDVSESPKRGSVYLKPFAEFSGYLIDFRGFRKLYFLGVLP